MSEVKVNKISPRTGTTLTLGDSGDTFAIPSGAKMSGIGTVSWQTSIKTSGFTAVSGEGYFCDTSSGAFSVTLPASPSSGNIVAIKDYKFTADTANITILRNGSNIQGTATNYNITGEGDSIVLVYADSTQGWLVVGAAQKSDISQEPLFTSATGGTITTSGDFKIHTFTGPGTFCVSQVGNNSPTIPAGGPAVVDYLVVAGGGSGAQGDDDEGSGSGGGAGGFRESHSTPVSGSYTASPLATPTGITLTATAFPITVGGGGTASPPATPVKGSNSIFSTITSAGGGGGCRTHPGRGCGAQIDGGSGGGGLRDMAGNPAGLGNTPPVSPSQGNPGGAGGTDFRATGGGGGGATAAGTAQTNAGCTPNNPRPGVAGGAGATTNITGSPVAYAGGGSSGSAHNNTTVTGGTGGGGTGGASCGAITPVGGVSGGNGTINTGGGGGGGANGGAAADAFFNGIGGLSGAGGSGIVIIRYKFQ